MINTLMQMKIQWDLLEIDKNQEFLSDYNHWSDQYFTWSSLNGSDDLFVYLFIEEIEGRI